MRPPPDSKTPLLRSSRWGGRGCWGNASRTSFMLSSLLLGGKKGALLLTALNYYSAGRSHQAVRAAGFPLPEESGGWDPSPRCRCYQACQSDSRRRLFTQVRGRGILGSPFAGSWIRPRNTPVQRPRTGPIGVRGGRYYRGLDRYANLFFVIFGDGHVAPTFRVVAPKYLMG